MKVRRENIVIGQVCRWNTNRRAKKHRKPEYDEYMELRIKQVWRGDKLAQVVTLNGQKETVRFDYLEQNYLADRPDLQISGGSDGEPIQEEEAGDTLVHDDGGSEGAQREGEAGVLGGTAHQ